MDHSVLMHSKTYRNETGIDIIERRELACELLKKDVSLTRQQLVDLMDSRGVKVGLSTLANDVAAIAAAENFLAGHLSWEEVQNEKRPYRKMIYFGIRCLVKDGLGPSGPVADQAKNEVGLVQGAEAVVPPLEEKIQAQVVPEISALSDLPVKKLEGLLERRQEFYREIDVLILENQILDGQLRLTNKSLEEETALRVRQQTRSESLRKAFVAYIRKTRSGSLYQIVNRQGHEVFTLNEKIQQLEFQLGGAQSRVSCLEATFEACRSENVTLCQTIKTLEDDLAFKQLEMEELQRAHDSAEKEDVLANDDGEALQISQEEPVPGEIGSGKWTDVFPSHCYSPDIPMVPGEDFMSYYEKLPEEIKTSTMKALNLVATNGLYYPSLQTKKRRDGQKQFHISMSYRLFFDIVEGELVLFSIKHKNAL